MNVSRQDSLQAAKQSIHGGGRCTKSVSIAPQVNTGLHTTGFDAAYLLDGDLTVLDLGQPAKPIRAGHSWHVRPGVVHEVKAGDRPAKVLAMYVVEKGKPLATPWQPSQSN